MRTHVPAATRRGERHPIELVQFVTVQRQRQALTDELPGAGAVVVHIRATGMRDVDSADFEVFGFHQRPQTVPLSPPRLVQSVDAAPRL